MTKHSLILSGALLLMLVTGCSHQESPLSSDVAGPGLDDVNSNQTLLLGTEVSSAQLNMFIGFANNEPVELHRIISDWDPATVTWTGFAGAFNPNIESSFMADANGWHTVDVTALIQSWAAGETDNFGLLLEQSSPTFFPLMVRSIESATASPFLEICYDTPDGSACDTVLARADVFIDEAEPDVSTEGSAMLLVGQTESPGTNKQALIRFELPDVLFAVTPSTIGSRVWQDVNQDGIYDPDEPGLPGVTVNLYDCQETMLAATVSDLTGSYRFDSLSSGCYLVEFVAPQGYLFSPMDQEIGDTLDSDADPTTGRTHCFVVDEGVAALNWDAGLFLEVVITDSGCTRSKGYWKNHAGFGPQDDDLSSLLPIWLGEADGDSSLLVDTDSVAVAVLTMKTYGTPSNGITKLYAQLLAAKLNIASGALADEVAATIEEADAFLADHTWSGWARTDRQDNNIVLDWKDILDSYNNGEIGPGSCD